MNALPAIRRLLPLWLGFAAMAARAEDSHRAEEVELRAALTRSLTFLTKAGDAWMNERNCNSCHTMPLLLWSHRAAKERGISIDEKAFGEFVGWTYERAKKETGLEVLAFLRLAMPDKATPEMTKTMVGTQQADGSWKPGAQFLGQRREIDETNANSARIALLAIATQDTDPSVVEAARAKAGPVLGKDASPKSVDTLVFRSLYARRFGQSEEVATLRAELLKLQHADGGWGWAIADERSDSMATGEALYALQQTSEPSAAEAIARGQHWLLTQQREDGGWSIDVTQVSKGDRSAPAKAKSLKDATGIYTFWGSAWAAIGLLQGLPVVDTPTVTATP